MINALSKSGDESAAVASITAAVGWRSAGSAGRQGFGARSAFDECVDRSCPGIFEAWLAAACSAEDRRYAENFADWNEFHHRRCRVRDSTARGRRPDHRY